MMTDTRDSDSVTPTFRPAVKDLAHAIGATGRRGFAHKVPLAQKVGRLPKKCQSAVQAGRRP